MTEREKSRMYTVENTEDEEDRARRLGVSRLIGQAE
jgi:hypothetical protein